MGEEVAQISVAIQATNDTASGIAAATASLKSGASEMGDALSETGAKATGAGGALEILSEKLQAHKESAKQASANTKFFSSELTAILGPGSEVGAVLGKLAGGLAAGGPVGLAIGAATVAVGLLSKAFSEQVVEVKKVDTQLTTLEETYYTIIERSRKAKEAMSDVWVTDQATKTIAEMERAITWQQKLLSAEKDRVNLGDEWVGKQIESGRLKWESAIVDEMNKEKEVTQEGVEAREANIEALKNELAIKVKSLANEREVKEIKDQEKSSGDTAKTKARSGGKDEAEERARELRTLDFLEDTLAKQADVRARSEEKSKNEAIKREKEKAEEIEKIVDANEDRRRDLFKKTSDYQNLLAKQQAQTEVAVARSIADAWSTASLSIIDNSKTAGKAMVKAFVSSIKSIVMAYAAQAAASAMAANSGIPVVGIAVGTVAAGLAFAIVEGMIDKIPSARGGFDVPSGLNPLTQLHEREMVLPAQIADPLRAALATGGGMPAAPNIYINGIDGPSIMKLVESPAFNNAIKENLRNNR